MSTFNSVLRGFSNTWFGLAQLLAVATCQIFVRDAAAPVHFDLPRKNCPAFLDIERLILPTLHIQTNNRNNSIDTGACRSARTPVPVYLMKL